MPERGSFLRIVVDPTQHAGQYNMPSRLEKTLHTRFITDLNELCERLNLSKELSSSLKEATNKYSFLIPESLLDRVKINDLNDPVLKQFLPSPQELEKKEGFVRDRQRMKTRLSTRPPPKETPVFYKNTQTAF